MSSKNCLIIEDNQLVANLLSQALHRNGFNNTVIKDAETAFEKLKNTSFDIILLDLMLPGMNGEEFIRLLRAESTLPIIVISEKKSDVGKAISLDLGADDYISKPVSIIELIARIKAVLRRTKQKQHSDILTFKNITMDKIAHKVYKNNKPVLLSAKEYNILKYFMENPKRVLTKENIFNRIWKQNYYDDHNIINVHIRRLRKKIEDNPSKPTIIETVWGVGYCLTKH
ncbi:MAG: response regulator transcription factor [Bacillota bacterium]